MTPRPPRCLAGTLLRPDGQASEGWVVHDGERVLDAGEGKPPREPDARGLVTPAFTNAHTHVADMVARGRDRTGLSLAEVVAPPDGLKHRILRATAAPALLDGMRRALAENAAAGCRSLVDFREQGADGARLLREAAKGAPSNAIVLGRPTGSWDDSQAKAVLDIADGFGLSALGDVSNETPERMAAAAHAHGKRFALHLSEARREDVSRALDLRPDFLVHMVHADADDLATVASAAVPIVLCPRSNALFGPTPDARAMLDAGIVLALGSDNAMFHALDPLEDARVLAARDETLHAPLFEALVTGGARAARLKPPPRDPFAKGARADLIVHEADDAPGLRTLFGERRPRVLLTTWSDLP